MLDRFKDIGNQVAHRANEAVEGVTSTVRDGVGNLAHAASTATGNLNDKAVRAATAQMCSILEAAIDEVKSRPLGERPVVLTATVNIGIPALQMQVHCGAPGAVPGGDTPSGATPETAPLV
jgi:hypothetical protein